VQSAPPSVERERLKHDKLGREVAMPRPFQNKVKLSTSRVELSTSDAKPGETFTSWPMLIVCAAANVSDPGATPPGRPVASFTFSPTAIGGPLTGATRTTTYEHLSLNRRRDVTLPAAVAMSGAALSPSMGKLTYRPLTFLLALANIRLGVWVPNPRHINDVMTVSAESYNPPEPPSESAKTQALLKPLAPKGPDKQSVKHRPTPVYLWKELFGRNRLDDQFLYVTDGGHYENLGLVELLRRGCGTIYCFDAGGGSTSKALGDAIALARTELNVLIKMEDGAKHLEESKTPPLRSKAVCAKGTITYPDGTTGHLLYVRSIVSEESPWDLLDYQVEDNVFPHHSTFDQFFDDQKFEAYRRLGMYAAGSAVKMASAEPDTSNGARQVDLRPYSATGKIKLEFEPDEPEVEPEAS
jgi:hypothetical protein